VDAFSLVSNWTTPAAADFGVSFFNTAVVTLSRGTSSTLPVILQRRNGFNGTVTLTCSVTGATNTTCSVNPTTVNPDGTVNVVVTASTSAAMHAPVMPWLESAFGVAAFVGMGAVHRNRKRMAIFAVLMLVLLAGMVACGGRGLTTTTASGSTGSTSTSNATVTVTATSGSLSHTAQASLQVN